MNAEHHEFRIGRVFRIGFAFFITSLFWPVYNAYVPLFLDRFFPAQLPKNIIMTADNIFALTVIPLFSVLSDRTSSRFGRRKPYIFAGTVVAAALYALFPNLRFTLVPFLIVLFSLNISMASFRGPAVSLMPDLVRPEHRAKGNGVVTLMAGLAGAIVFSMGAVLYAVNPAYPFYFTSALMLFALIPLVGIREPAGLAAKERHKPLRTLMRELKGKNLIRMVVPMLLWGMALSGVEATLSNHLTKFLGMPENLVTVPGLAYAVAAIASSVPAGYVSARTGKRRGLMIGLAGAVVMFVINGLIGTVIPYNFALLIVGSGLLGVFGAMVAINAYPLAVEDIPPEEIGSYSGLYYFFTNFHPILGPILLGAIIDTIGFKVTYFYGGVGHLLALVALLVIPLYEVRERREQSNQLGRIDRSAAHN